MIRKNNQEYVITTYSTFPDKRQPHVIQTFDMRLIASAWHFLATGAGEHNRRLFLASNPNPYYWTKVPGLRVYLRLEGSFRRIQPDEEQERQEDIHNALIEMAKFYETFGLTEGQHRQFRDREVTYTPNTTENDIPAE